MGWPAIPYWDEDVKLGLVRGADLGVDALGAEGLVELNVASGLKVTVLGALEGLLVEEA